MDTPGERLELFIKQEFRTKREFCKTIGMHENSLNKYCGVNSKSIFGQKYQAKLAGLGLNMAWYLTGQGSMLLSETKQTKMTEGVSDVIPDEAKNTPQMRLEYFIKKVFGSKKAFTEALGVHQTWATSYTGKGTSVIREYTLVEKLSILGLNYNWYLTGEGEMLIANKEVGEEILPKITQLPNITPSTSPVVGYKVKLALEPVNCGRGVNFMDQVEAFIEVDKSFPESVIAFRVSGDSLNGVGLIHGSMVFADTALEAKDGDIIVAEVDGVLYSKILSIREGHKYLISANQGYEPMEINGFNRSKIIGVVVDVHIDTRAVRYAVGSYLRESGQE